MLYFFPGDFTSVCPTELTAVASRYEEIKTLGAEVLAISLAGRSLGIFGINLPVMTKN